MMGEKSVICILKYQNTHEDNINLSQTESTMHQV